MSKTYRIAIIGVGGIANLHAKAIGDLNNAQLVAGSCRTEEKGRKFASDFNCTWYADYEKMLDKQKPDLATICMPSGAHLASQLAPLSVRDLKPSAPELVQPRVIALHGQPTVLTGI